ncbi:MAG: hypothetical protein AAF828_11010 [Bacteroidota bacterium]
MKTGLITIIFFFCLFSLWAQGNPRYSAETNEQYRYRISVPGITLPQLATKSWNDRKHTQHLELQVKRVLDDKNIIGLKFATWRLFQPMGILWWDGLTDKLDSESEFYPGHVRASGIGVTYQRMLWKGLFASVEVLPQFQTYLDLDKNKVGDGFQLYNSYHLGYHLAFGPRKRFFIEPQVHCNHWLFAKNAPEGFRELDDRWRNHFLFEPNIYLGFNF